MTAHVHTTIRCEHPGCTAAYGDDGWPGSVRTSARRKGWTADPDLCPHHPTSADEPHPTLFDIHPCTEGTT